MMHFYNICQNHKNLQIILMLKMYNFRKFNSLKAFYFFYKVPQKNFILEPKTFKNISTFISNRHLKFKFRRNNLFMI